LGVDAFEMSGRGRGEDRARRMRSGRGPHFGGNIEKAENIREALMRLLSYLRPYRLSLVLVVVLVVASTLLSLIGPYLIGVAIDDYILKGDLPGLLYISIIMLGTYAASALTSMGGNWIMATVAQRTLKNLRAELFEHLQTLSLGFYDKRQTGELMSRLTNDIDAINTALSQNVTQLITNLLTLVGIIILMFSINIWLALGSLIVFPIMMGVTAFVGRRTRSGFRDLQMNLGKLTANTEEALSGERVIIAFNKQEEVIQSFNEINMTVRDIGIRAMSYALIIPPIMGILSNANIAVLAGLGGWLVLNGMSTVGTIATFISYSRRFAQPLRWIANLYNSIQSALAGSERIFEVIDTEPEIIDAMDAIPLDDVKGQVIFDSVDFEYNPGVPVLKEISLKAEPGQMIALVGPTGAGKTTIVNVLTRFYEINNGTITIDGNEISKVKKDDLRRQLGIVLQDVLLFSGTVMENIRYGRLKASDEECIEAAVLANADGFIRRLPRGYYTELVEGGSNLSQGQRQLISIARTILADPGILILDEATSSVDTRTEFRIQEALLRLMEGRTSFVIAHRLSTIRRANQLLVINDGRIIERGTHDELLQKKGYYHKLYMSQFKGVSPAIEKPQNYFDHP